MISGKALCPVLAACTLTAGAGGGGRLAHVPGADMLVPSEEISKTVCHSSMSPFYIYAVQ